MRLVELDAERERKWLPAELLPVILERHDTGVVRDGRIGVGRLVTVFGGVLAARTMHLPERFGLVIVRRQVREADGPFRRDASSVLDFVEIALAHPHQRGAVERRVTADPIVGIWGERRPGLVVPALLRPIAALDEHGFGIPVLGFARQMLAALEDEDRFAGRCEPLRQRRAAGAGPNDHDVEVLGHLVFSPLAAGASLSR